MASAWLFADYDNNGYKDLFVSRTFKHSQLFHNNGGGTFTDVTKQSGMGEIVVGSIVHENTPAHESRSPGIDIEAR